MSRVGPGGWRFAIAAAGVAIALASLAFAQPPPPPASDAAPARPRIAVALADDAPELSKRMRAELEQLGFEVVAVRAGKPASRAYLTEVARTNDAAAALGITPMGDSVEIWVVDRVTGKTLLREVVVRGKSPEDADALVALRAVELLRASLLELKVRSESRGDVPVTPPVEQLAAIDPPDERGPAIAETTPRPAEPAGAEPSGAPDPPPEEPPRSIFFGAGVGVTGAPGGVGAAAQVALRTRWSEMFGPFGASALALVPAVPATVSRREGVADIATWVFALELEARRPGQWQPGGGIGAGLLWQRTRGFAADPFRGRKDDLVAFAPYLTGGVAHQFLPRLKLDLSTQLGIAAPRPSIRFAGREVADWGRPWLGGTVTLEVSPF